MPRGSKGQKRSADAIGNTLKVMRIATEEEPEDYSSAPEKSEAAAEVGRKGAAGRALHGLAQRREGAHETLDESGYGR